MNFRYETLRLLSVIKKGRSDFLPKTVTNKGVATLYHKNKKGIVFNTMPLIYYLIRLFFTKHILKT